MLLAPHILVGAAIASKFSNPALGLLFAFLSHFLLDRIPHWEYSIDPIKQVKARGFKRALPILRRVALDIFSGYTVLFLAVSASSNDIPFWAWAAGGFFGALPDGLSFLLFTKRGESGVIYNFLKLIWTVHVKIHYSKERGMAPLRIGLGTQTIAVLLSLYFLIF